MSAPEKYPAFDPGPECSVCHELGPVGLNEPTCVECGRSSPNAKLVSDGPARTSIDRPYGSDVQAEITALGARIEALSMALAVETANAAEARAEVVRLTNNFESWLGAGVTAGWIEADAWCSTHDIPPFSDVERERARENEIDLLDLCVLAIKVYPPDR